METVGGVTHTIGDVVNRNEVNIVGELAGGDVKEAIKDVQGVVNATNNAVDAYSNTNNEGEVETADFMSVDPRAIANTF